MTGIHSCHCGWCGQFEAMIKREHPEGLAYYCPRCKRLVLVKHEMKRKEENLLKR